VLCATRSFFQFLLGFCVERRRHLIPKYVCIISFSSVRKLPWGLGWIGPACCLECLVGSFPASTTFPVLAAPSRVVRLILSLPSVRLSPEGSRLLSYLCTCIAPVAVPACIAGMSVTYTSHRAQALTLVFIWLAAPRGAADIYVSLCFGPIHI
jgi:hypothetical protein